MMRQTNNTSVKNNAISKPNQAKNNFMISGLSGSLRDIFQSLQTLSKKGYCYVSVETLGKKSGYSRRTVQRALKNLKKLNYIRVEPCFNSCGGRLENCYTLVC